MPAKPAKPPIRIKYSVYADGYKPYLYAEPQEDELACVWNYVNRILHPVNNCYVHVEDHINKTTNTYFVEVHTGGHDITPYSRVPE